MANEEYQIMPYEEIENLKRQLEDLQHKSMDTLSGNIVEAMNKMTEAMNSMLQFFKAAAEEMKIEQNSPSTIDVKKLNDINEKLDRLLDQNKVMAEGIVAVADIVKESGVKEREEDYMSPPRPMPTFRMNDFDQPSQQIGPNNSPPPMPPPMMGSPPMQMPFMPGPSMPPPMQMQGPPQMADQKKRRSLFG